MADTERESREVGRTEEEKNGPNARVQIEPLLTVSTVVSPDKPRDGSNGSEVRSGGDTPSISNGESGTTNNDLRGDSECLQGTNGHATGGCNGDNAHGVASDNGDKPVEHSDPEGHVEIGHDCIGDHGVDVDETNKAPPENGSVTHSDAKDNRARISQTHQQKCPNDNNGNLDEAPSRSEPCETDVKSTESNGRKSPQKPKGILGKMGRMNSFFASKINSAIGNFDLDHCDPDVCVGFMRNPTMKTYSALKRKLKKADKDWIQGFLEADGLGKFLYIFHF